MTSVGETTHNSGFGGQGFCSGSNTNDGGSQKSGGSGGGGRKRGHDQSFKDNIPDEPTEKLPRMVTILFKTFVSPAPNRELLGFAVFNAYPLRNQIAHNSGRPANGFVTFETLRVPARDLIDYEEEHNFMDLNDVADAETTSLASTLLLSDLEKRDFNLPTFFVKGFHFVTKYGLNIVPTESWEGHNIVHSAVLANDTNKAAMLRTSYDRARVDIEAFCTASQSYPYKQIGQTLVRYTMRRQTKIVPPHLMDKFTNVLACSNYVSSHSPLNPNVNELIEDTD